VAPVEMKLRLYRNYSIKLMLAWEKCCRFDLPLIPLRGASILTSSSLNVFSYGIWHLVFIPPISYTRRSSGRHCVRHFVGCATYDFCCCHAHHPSEMSGRVRSYRMDAPAVWNHNGIIPQCFDTSHALPVHGCRVVCYRSSGNSVNRAGWLACRYCGSCSHNCLYL
jgi:hypothetical protein